MTDAKAEVRRHRARRTGSGAHAAIAAVLAILLFIIVNMLAQRFYTVWDVSRTRYYELSDKSRQILGEIGVGQGGKGHQLGAEGLQELKIVRVVETKSAVPGHPDAHGW